MLVFLFLQLDKLDGVPTPAGAGPYHSGGPLAIAKCHRFHFHERRSLAYLEGSTAKTTQHLLITKGNIAYQKRGDRSFSSVQPYTRQCDTLCIVSPDTTPVDPVLVTVAFLDAHQIVLRLVQPHPLGWNYDYSTYTSFYTK